MAAEKIGAEQLASGDTQADRLFDSFVRRRIFLERYSASTVRKVIKLLADTRLDILARLQGMETDWSQQRLERLLVELRGIETLAEERLYRELNGELNDLAKEEAGFAVRALEMSLPPPVRAAISFVAPSEYLLASIVTSKPFQGKILRDVVKELSDSEYRRLRDAVRIGMTEGESLQKIIARVKGTKEMAFKDGVFGQSNRQIEAVVRTTINHVSNRAHVSVMEANRAICPEWIFRATLDFRTSGICRSLDGSVYEVGKGPVPPRHWRCRSVGIPKTVDFSTILGKDVEELPESVRPFVKAKVPVSALTPEQRKQLIGTEPSSVTFDSWLKKQPDSIIKEVLGDTKAKLFTSGQLPLARMVDKAGTKEFTLAELRRREPEAFKRAGLSTE